MVLACHYPVTYGFDQHFQVTVHFPLSCAVDSPQQHQHFFPQNIFVNAGNQTQGSWVGKQVCQLLCNSAPVYNSFMVHCLDCTQIINILSKIIIFLHSILTHEAELKNTIQKFLSSRFKKKIKTAKSAMNFFSNIIFLAC